MKRNAFNLIVFLLIPIGVLIAAFIHREPTYQDKPASAWFEKLREDRAVALDALQHMGKDAIPALQAGLKSPAPTERCRAAWALGRIGPVARVAIPDLIRALDDNRPGVRYEAMSSLSRIGITNEDIVPKLVSMLTEPFTDSFAAVLLTSIEQERKAHNLPAVLGDEFQYDMAFLKSTTRNVRTSGAIKLAYLARNDERAEKALKSLLEDKDPAIRIQASVLMTNPAAIPPFKMIGD